MVKQLPDELKIAKEATVYAGGSASGGLLRYLFNILVARLHGVEILGIYALSNALIQMASRISSLGLEMGVVRYVSRLIAQKKNDVAVATIRLATGVGLGGGVLLGGMLVVYGDAIAPAWFNETSGQLAALLRWFALSIPFTIVARMTTAGSQGLKVLKHRVLALEIIPMIVLALGLALLSLTLSPIDAIGAAYVASQVVSMIVALFLLAPMLPLHRRPNAAAEPGLIRFSIPLIGAGLISTALTWSDLLMIGALLDSEAVGLYQPALRTATTFPMIASAFAAILSPIVSEHQVGGNHDKIAHLVKLTARWSLIIVLPLFIAVNALGPQILGLFGTQFMAGNNALQLLAVSNLVVALSVGSATVMTMMGRPGFALWNMTGALSINIALNLVLIPKYGIFGAAVSTSIALGLLALLRFVQNAIVLRINPLSMNMTKALLAGLITWVAMRLLAQQMSDWPLVVALIGGGLLIVTLYGLTIWRLGFSAEEKEVIEAFRRKIRRGIS